MVIPERRTELSVAVFPTPSVEKKRLEVITDPRNDPIVEKKRIFPIFSPRFSPSSISERSGSVCEARKMGIKKRIHAASSIDKK